MLEFSLLVLTAFISFVVSLFLLFYLLDMKSKEVERLKQVLQEKNKKARLHSNKNKKAGLHSNYCKNCSHFLGYLFDYPRNRPIPNGCMGCPDVFECLEYKKSKPTPPEGTSRVKELRERRTVKVRKLKATNKTSISKAKKEYHFRYESKTKPKRARQKEKVTRTRNKRG